MRPLARNSVGVPRLLKVSTLGLILSKYIRFGGFASIPQMRNSNKNSYDRFRTAQMKCEDKSIRGHISTLKTIKTSSI